MYKFKRYSSGKFPNKGWPKGYGISGKGEKQPNYLIPESDRKSRKK